MARPASRKLIRVSSSAATCRNDRVGLLVGAAGGRRVGDAPVDVAGMAGELRAHLAHPVAQRDHLVEGSAANTLEVPGRCAAMSIPASRITRTALGCSGLGRLPALRACTRPPEGVRASASRHLRPGAVAGAQEQQPRRRRVSGAAGNAGGGGLQAQARVQRPARHGQQAGEPRQVRRVIRSRGGQPSCAAPTPARPTAACPGGKRPGSAARRAARSARPTRRSLRASSRSSRHRSG